MILTLPALPSKHGFFHWFTAHWHYGEPEVAPNPDCAEGETGNRLEYRIRMDVCCHCRKVRKEDWV